MKTANLLSEVSNDTTDLIGESFQAEVMKSEKLRVMMLSVFFTGAAAWIYFQSDVLPFPIKTTFHGIPAVTWFSVCLLGVALYEFIVSRVFSFFIVSGRTLPRQGFYMNALVETSLPSLIIFVMSKVIAVSALFTPAAFLYFIFISFSVLRLNYRLCVFTGAVAAAGYLTVSLIVLSQSAPAVLPGEAPTLLNATAIHVNKAMMMLVTGGVTGFVAAQIKKRILSSYQLINERSRVEKVFGQHVSPEVVERLLNQPKGAGGEMRQVCVMFLDIRNFTAFSDQHTPTAVVDYLNTLFDFMIDIINQNHGIINKFLGDGFMAVFGAPFSEGNDSQNAVRAAMAIIERVNAGAGDGTLPPTRVGVGLHAGEAVTGNIGSTVRREYTVIGDVVNLAARIEGLNKTFDSQLLVSDVVYEAVKSDVQPARELGPVEIRGLKEAIPLYQLV